MSPHANKVAPGANSSGQSALVTTPSVPNANVATAPGAGGGAALNSSTRTASSNVNRVSISEVPIGAPAVPNAAGLSSSTRSNQSRQKKRPSNGSVPRSPSALSSGKRISYISAANLGSHEGSHHDNIDSLSIYDDIVDEDEMRIGNMRLEDILNEEDYASWKEVFTSCCYSRSLTNWIKILISAILLLAILYIFAIGIELLGGGAKVLGGCTAGTLLSQQQNPVSNLMIGILATVMMQSSSTSTSIVVSLVGAGSLTVQEGIYTIMGANCGTAITNTLVSFCHFTKKEQFGRAFAGAAIHDMYNFMTVGILFPIELATGFLFRLTATLIRAADTHEGDTWEGPVKRYVKPLVEKIIVSNKNVIKDVAKGRTCDSFYPLECDSSVNPPTKKSCSKVGLIACSKKTGACPAFFQPDATLSDDQFSGLVVLILGFFVLFIAMVLAMKLLHYMLVGTSTRIINTVTNINGYLAIALGTGFTMMAQSSSTTTSLYTPLVGMGLLRLDQMLPLTFGSNIGTTITAMLTALATDGNGALQVALAHLFFNITGVMIWFPAPFMRRIPMRVAKRVGLAAQVIRVFPFVYVFMLFLAIPATILGLSIMFTSDNSSLTAGACFIGALLIILLLRVCYWWNVQHGQQMIWDHVEQRKRITRAKHDLPMNMNFIERTLRALVIHTRLPIRANEIIEGDLLQIVMPSIRKINDEFDSDDDNDDDDSNSGTGDDGVSGTSSVVTEKLYRKYRSKLRYINPAIYWKKSAKHNKVLSTLPQDMNLILCRLQHLSEHSKLPLKRYKEAADKEMADKEGGATSEGSVSSSDGAYNSPRQQHLAKRRGTHINNGFYSFLQVWDQIPMLYRIMMILSIPLAIFAIVKLFLHHSTPYNALGAMVCMIIAAYWGRFTFHWFLSNGSQEQYLYWKERHERYSALTTLPQDLKRINTLIERLYTHLGLRYELDDDEEEGAV